MKQRIYLDFNASTPVAPEVAAEMGKLLAEPFGNPSSGHWAGRPAHELVERARAQLASLLGCEPAAIVFTSGGSEANNHALKGAFFASAPPRPHIITTRIEHPAILSPCRFLERLGASVTYLPVDGSGRVDPDDVRRAITQDTILISVMHGNNEVGTIQPLAEISLIAREQDVLLHTDAAQTVGKIPARVSELGVDLLSIAGHKLYAPKGVGALYIREGIRVEPLVHGAGHEAGRRAGTENLILDVGLGAACDLAESCLPEGRTPELRDRFWSLLKERFSDRIILNGHPVERLPNTLNVSFVGESASEILTKLPDIAASTGSACHSGAEEPSPVLKAMGVPSDVALGAIRFSLGRITTVEEIEEVVEQLSRVLERPS